MLGSIGYIMTSSIHRHMLQFHQNSFFAPQSSERSTLKVTSTLSSRTAGTLLMAVTTIQFFTNAD